MHLTACRRTVNTLRPWCRVVTPLGVTRFGGVIQFYMKTGTLSHESVPSLILRINRMANGEGGEGRYRVRTVLTAAAHCALPGTVLSCPTLHGNRNEPSGAQWCNDSIPRGARIVRSDSLPGGGTFLPRQESTQRSRLKGRYGTKRPLKNPPPLRCSVGWEFGRYFRVLLYFLG